MNPDKSQGFTLIEVLVALLVLSLALLAGTRASEALIFNADHHQRQMAAQWCAQNALVGVRLQGKIPDIGKEVEHLGAFPLPIEVIPFGWQTTKSLIEEALINLDVDGRTSTLRLNKDEAFRTDEGNLILDLHLGRLEDARQVSLMLNQIPGVVENGLFIDLCDVVIVGAADGSVVVRDINNGTVTNEQVDVNENDNIFTDVDG